MTSDGGTISGGVTRRFDWTKTSPYTHQMGTGMSGIAASAFLDQPGALYVKQWDEAGTMYTTLVAADVLDAGAGFSCSLPPGTYSYQFQGEAVVAAHIPVTAEAASASWRGWNLLSNPLTGFVDLAATSTSGPGSMGATYHWVDSLQTWVAQVGGVGQFGHAGIVHRVTPSGPSPTLPTIGPLTTRPGGPQHVEAQSSTIPESMLILEMGNGLLVEQCAIVLEGGEEAFDRSEDAQFASSFRGRNNLDIYSQTADSVSVMVNRTTSASQVIPVWIKASIGSLLTLEAPDIAPNLCLVLEDVETGWTGGIEPGFTYEFSPTSGSDHHRFNLIVGNDMMAEATNAACESASDLGNFRDGAGGLDHGIFAGRCRRRSCRNV